MSLVWDDDKSVIDFVVQNGVKGLVDSGLTSSQIPNKFLQPLTERIAIAAGSGSGSGTINNNIPFPSALLPIDLSKLDGPDHVQVVKAIAMGAENVGFFQVVNHGVPLELLDSILASAHRFFNQSREAKAAYSLQIDDQSSPLISPAGSPFAFYGSSFAPEKEKVMEWRDLLSLLYTNDAEALLHWPDVCKKEALEFLKSCMEVMRKIFKVLVENLKVTSLDSTRMESLLGVTRLNMNFYPPCPNPELTLGAKRHSDVTILTLLLQDAIGGLQVKLKEDNWVDVPPIPGAIIINIGDTLQILSNGNYKSAEHRVRTNNKESRVSVPLLIFPLPMENIGPLSQLVERDGVARYRQVLYKDYREIYMGNIGDGKISLDCVKLNTSAP